MHAVPYVFRAMAVIKPTSSSPFFAMNLLTDFRAYRKAGILVPPSSIGNPVQFEAFLKDIDREHS